MIGWGTFWQEHPGEDELGFATMGAGSGIDAGEGKQAVLPGGLWGFLRLRWGRRSQKRTTVGNSFLSAPVAQQAVMPDSDEAFWEDVEQESADELQGRQ